MLENKIELLQAEIARFGDQEENHEPESNAPSTVVVECSFFRKGAEELRQGESYQPVKKPVDADD